MTRVIVLLWDATMTTAALEAIGAAQRVAKALQATFEAAALNPSGALVSDLAHYGVTSIHALTGDAARGDLVAALTAAFDGGSGDILIAARGPRGLDVLPRLAARTKGACVMGVVAIEVGGGDLTAIAAIYGGAARATYRLQANGLRILSLASGQEPERAVSVASSAVVRSVIPADPRVRVLETPRSADGPRLEDAAIVVSGGRGLRDGKNYQLIRELAAALGGMPGASRAIVDESWARPLEQVGLTGKIVTPTVYFAFGISGASQHMAGCSNARTIVAVNTDPDAPIFRYAHLGIVADCLDVLPELIKLANAHVTPR